MEDSASPGNNLFSLSILHLFILVGGVVLLSLSCPCAQERPPEQGSKLLFKKTLFVQPTAQGKIFAETKQLKPGESLWKIFSEQYNIPTDSLDEFFDAFKEINPSVNIDKLRAGQVVRIPFKIEASLPSSPSPPSFEAVYTVRPGDNLWKILSRKYLIPTNQIPAALKAIARSNPRMKDLNKLFVGQRVSIPKELLRESDLADVEEKAEIPKTVFSLLEDLGCVVSRQGETFLPLQRGRTLKFEAKDFPLITSPSGKKVILDPENRVSPALVRSIDEAWNYKIVSGIGSAEVLLEKVLPPLSFYELAEGEQLVSLGGGSELKALPRWTVVSSSRDLWEGRIHLIFPDGAMINPVLAETARKSGFSVHILGAEMGKLTDPTAPTVEPPEIKMKDPAEGAAELLSLLGVPHQVRPEVASELDGGIIYKVRPEITFQFEGMRFAIPPQEPKQAESILYRAGYFTIAWSRSSSALNKLGDLLALLGVPHARSTVEAPAEQSLQIVVRGIVLDEPKLARILYPAFTSGENSGDSAKIILTEGPMPAGAASILTDEGLLPWVVTSR